MLHKSLQDRAKTISPFEVGLVLYCWAGGLFLCVVCTICETPLEKTNFQFSNSCKLEIACWLGMGDHLQFSHSVLGSHLSGSYADIDFVDATVSVSSSMCRSCCVWKVLFPWCLLSPLTFTVLPPLRHLPVPSTVILLFIQPEYYLTSST